VVTTSLTTFQAYQHVYGCPYVDVACFHVCHTSDIVCPVACTPLQFKKTLEAGDLKNGSVVKLEVRQLLHSGDGSKTKANKTKSVLGDC